MLGEADSGLAVGNIDKAGGRNCAELLAEV